MICTFLSRWNVGFTRKELRVSLPQSYRSKEVRAFTSLKRFPFLNYIQPLQSNIYSIYATFKSYLGCHISLYRAFLHTVPTLLTRSEDTKLPCVIYLVILENNSLTQIVVQVWNHQLSALHNVNFPIVVEINRVDFHPFTGKDPTLLICQRMNVHVILHVLLRHECRHFGVAGYYRPSEVDSQKRCFRWKFSVHVGQVELGRVVSVIWNESTFIVCGAELKCTWSNVSSWRRLWTLHLCLFTC